MSKDKKETKIKLIPLGDRVLIKEDNDSSERKTGGGIIIPITSSEDKGSKQGTIIAVGAGKYDDGKLIPISVKVGESVLFQWGDKVKIDGNEYYLVRESEILAIVK